MKLEGKVALVTGGAVRIGRAIGEALAAEGAIVAVHYRSSRREAAALARDLGGFSVPSDLASESACERLVSDVIRAAGRLDVLINNAAVFHKDSLRGATAARLGQEFWPNLFVPILLTRAFASRVKRGVVVNLLDRRITSRDTECLPYVLSKKSLAEFTKIAALELAPGIRVNGVAPGAVLPPPGKGARSLRDLAGPVPLKRPVRPADIADAVAFLAKSESVTGQIVFVDGGQSLLGNMNGA